jgi:hypothetical protein
MVESRPPDSGNGGRIETVLARFFTVGAEENGSRVTKFKIH